MEKMKTLGNYKTARLSIYLGLISVGVGIAATIPYFSYMNFFNVVYIICMIVAFFILLSILQDIITYWLDKKDIKKR